MHPFRRTLPKGAIWGQTPMWHRNFNIKINQVRAWKRWWYCCLFLCHNHSSLFSLKMSTKITPNKLSDCLVLQKKAIYRLEGCPFSGWSIAALVRQHRGGFSFTCVQQSWTTLAGVIGVRPPYDFLKEKGSEIKESWSASFRILKSVKVDYSVWASAVCHFCLTTCKYSSQLQMPIQK